MIVGDSGVGKTSLREAYLEGEGLDRKNSFAQQMATPMTDSREKSITIEEENFQGVLELIDTRGDNHNNQYTDYSQAEGFLMCYDVTQRATFESLVSLR